LENSVSDDEGTIHDRRTAGNEAFIEESLAQPHKFERLVFARVKDPLGTLFRFKGRYRIDPEASRAESAIVHRRLATRAETYQ
jgi:hypothetical protein